MSPTAVGTTSNFDDRYPNVPVVLKLAELSVVALCPVPGNGLSDNAWTELAQRLDMKDAAALVRLGAVCKNVVCHG
jgi:hypothetical protein